MDRVAPHPPNRLASETSPYLLQHAHNPVDWYPWGPEALQRARDTDKPIFLSIGYAACHWCHVMEDESFEDEGTAAQLNDGFVAVKVDREERPDIDAIYMDAVQAMTGGGGWPMSVFLTPDGRPFYGGTYFPDRPRHGLPSFRQVLASVREAWLERRADVEASASRLAQHIDSGLRGPTPRITLPAPTVAADQGEPPTSRYADQLGSAMAALEAAFDARHGGFGSAPKFPQPMTIEFLLREHQRTGDPRALAMARRTLDTMADGGIHDHLDGGFARYATDAAWLVPHFEKMLYDNAQLARVYLRAWHLTGEARYRLVAVETLDFAIRRLGVADRGRAGPHAFASSLDADTQGVEGATYTWDAAEIRTILGDDAPLFEAAYGVTESGNWEGRTILSRVHPDEDLAASTGLPVEEVAARLQRSRAELRRVRERRPQPRRDDKVLTAWNGLMIGALADGGRLLGDPDLTTRASEAAAAVLEVLGTPEGRLLRSWKDGRARHAGVLEDHSHLADGLLAVYEATFDERWFVAARQLADVMLEHFADPAGGFFDTADDAERLIARPRSLGDNALPSGNAMATSVLIRLAALTGEGRYGDMAMHSLDPIAPLASRYPTAFSQWLIALQLASGPIDEVAIVGDPDADDTGRLIAVVGERRWPPTVLAVGADTETSAIPLLQGRAMVDRRATAYVCRGFACRMPVTDADALRAELGLTPAATQQA